jgi:TctA family transporter
MMSAASISHEIQSIGFLTYIRESEDLYPIILATHLSSIAIFGGMILMTDLRLLGLAMTDLSVTDVVRQLRIWKRIGLVIMVTMGLLLATSEMDKYYGNPYFQLKMCLLLMVGVHAAVFRRGVYGNTEALDRAPEMPRLAKAAAISSLALWIGIACAGRWIAYFEPPKSGTAALQETNGASGQAHAQPQRQ